MLGYSDIVENFELFDNWEDRYAYLIELGKDLPALDNEDRIDSNRIHGCVSQVWLVVKRDEEGKLFFRADSDSFLVRGVVATLFTLFRDKTPQELLALDVEPHLDKLGLRVYLTPQRSNGLSAVIDKIRQEARKLV